jgi:hypothetical protein
MNDTSLIIAIIGVSMTFVGFIGLLFDRQQSGRRDKHLNL